METKYILKHNFILVIILAVIVNVLVFYKSLLDYESVYYDDNGYKYDEYVEIYSEYVEIANELDGAGIDDIISELKEYQRSEITDSTREVHINAYKKAIENVKYANNYNNIIDESIEQTEQKLKSGLYGEGFGYCNLLKGRYDLKKINNIKLKPIVSIAVESLCDYHMTPIISAVVMMIMISFFKYDNVGLKTVVQSTKKGRLYLALKRCGLITILSVIVNLIMFVPILFISFNRYGGGQYLNSPIQASEYFTYAPYEIDFKGLLMLLLIFNIISSIVWALMCWFISQLFYDKTTGIIFVSAFVLIEYVLYNFSYNNMMSEFFKDINVINYLNLSDTFVNYNNWGISEYLITTFSLTIIGVSLSVILLAVLNIYMAAGIWNGIIINSAILERIKKYVKRCFAYLPGTLKEIKKIIIDQRVGLIVVTALIFVWNYNFGKAGLVNSDELELKDYYEYVKGDSYEKTDEYLADMDEWLENARQLLATYNESGNIIDALDISKIIKEKEKKREMIIEASSSAKMLSESGIHNIRVVDKEKISKRYGARTINYSNNITFLVMILLVVSFSKTFMIERVKKTEWIIRATSKGGRKFVVRKTLIELAIAEVVVVLLHFIQLYRVNKAFPMQSYELNASIKSVELFYNSPVNITFLQLEAICLLVRMFIVGALCITIAMASLLYNEAFIYICSLVVVLPYILNCIGLDFLKDISIIKYIAFYEAPANQYALIQYSIVIVAVSVLMISTIIRGIKRWEMS